MQTRSHHTSAKAGSTTKNQGEVRVSARRPRCPTPAQVEGSILRQAAGLGLDSARHPDARRTHGAYLNGAIGCVLSLGLITEGRALKLRTACGELLDGTAMPDHTGLLATMGPVDTAYARIIGAVRRHGGASIYTPAEVADLGVNDARRMLDHLRADGVIDEADMLGFFRFHVEH